MMESHRFYKQAYDAHCGTSFSPEKRAVSELNEYERLRQLLVGAGKETALEKFDSLWLKTMYAKARCVSTMIAGPANFPVARMQKYNQWERSASDAFYGFVNRVLAPPKVPRTELDYKIEEKEYTRGAVRVLQNAADNRLQLFFDDKPGSAQIATLRNNGYKWSPRNKAWQRQLTPNVLHSLHRVLPVETPIA